jgi:hypothetical protein
MKDRPSYTGRQLLNQHLHRHHGGHKVSGDLGERLAQHDELHWWDRQQKGLIGHTHLPYQEGESDNEMAARMLADGTAAQQSSE